MDIGVDIGPVKLLEDNMSTIQIIGQTHTTNRRTRHLNVRYFFIRDRIKNGEIQIVFCPTDEMLADLMTKHLAISRFGRLRDAILSFNT